MANSQDLGKIQDLRETLGKGDEKRVKAQREAGKLTARERILKIADVGSFVELFAFVSEQEEGAGVVTGYATVQQRPVYLFAQDFTVHGGAIGKLQAQKINKILDMALKTGAPVLMLCDSAGVRLDEGAEAMNAFAEIYRSMARLSGVCPMISVILGPCIGGAALIAQLSDISILAKDVGQLMMFGPQVLSAMNGISYDIQAVGGAEMMAKQGACSLLKPIPRTRRSERRSISFRCFPAPTPKTRSYWKAAISTACSPPSIRRIPMRCFCRCLIPER